MENYSTQTIFLNNALGHFYQSFINWFSDSFYDDINTKIISTYTKAIKKLNSRLSDNDLPDVILPTIIVDPSGDFEPEEATNQLWRYDDLSYDRVSQYYEPLYIDDEVMITPIFNRFVGEMEVTLLLRSIYEYLDMRIYLIQKFKNKDRYSRPFFVNTFLILPEELINLQYDNLDGSTRSLDWSTALMETKLIKNMNQNEYTIPLVLTPRFKYSGISEASNRKSVGSELEDYKISINITYEIELPVYFYIKSDYKLVLPPTISLLQRKSSANIFEFPQEFILDTDDVDPQRPRRSFTIRKILYIDIKTSSDLDNILNTGILISEDFEDYQCIKLSVNDKDMKYHDDYIHDDTDIHRILFSDSRKQKLEINDHIEIAVYDPKD